MKPETFQTSRLLDFCSERELTKQIGHSADLWPLVISKELTDNGLDACEEAGIAPVIDIEVTGTEITITDNGPGNSTGTWQFGRRYYVVVPSVFLAGKKSIQHRFETRTRTVVFAPRKPNLHCEEPNG